MGATSFTNYDGVGNVGNIIDLNNQTTSLTYDGRNRVLASTINGVQSSRSFNTAGDLSSVTDSGNRALAYTYDLTYGRLDKITDEQGNYLFFDYDLQGNLIEDSSYDQTTVRKRWLRFDFQNPEKPGKLWKIINPDDTATVLEYDSVGNIVKETDPLTRETSFSYDALSRLEQIIEPGLVTTSHAYDNHGNLETVTDAGLKATGHVYDDMGRVLSVTSPDSGVTSYVYDIANNQMHKTDANNVTTTHSFDALGRLIGVSFPDAAQNIVYTYDENTNGTGLLTTMDDGSGSTIYTYNTIGQLTHETRTNTGMPSASIIYGYNPTSADLETVTYPSGLILSYQRDANGSISVIQADGQDIVKNIHYMPFGPVSDYDFTLGSTDILSVDRSINDRYQIDNIQAGSVMNFGYGYYADGSVSSISGETPVALTSSVVSDTFLINGTNQIDYIDTITPPAFVQYSYDDNSGNITSDGTRTFSYDESNRLVQVTDVVTSAVIAVYSYDGLNRRVKKTAGSSIVYYQYDINNNLIAETDGTGVALRDYIYLGSEPFAMKVYGAQAGIYYFLNDHLGTPQKLVDNTATVVWESAYLPFGEAQVKTGTVTNNIRFPGQYFDAETGLHYNWNRYYDPETGRYLTPDPIGLAGGINLYSYANQNPISYVDPDGKNPLLFGVIGAGVLLLTNPDSGNAPGPCDDPVNSTGLQGMLVESAIAAVLGPIGGKFAGWFGKNASKGADNIADFAKYKEHLRQLQNKGKSGYKELQNGSIRYYGDIKPASNPGEMIGRRLVREWNPSTGAKRTWHETLDHSGNIRIVRPQRGISKKHHTFDASGNYTGSF